MLIIYVKDKYFKVYFSSKNLTLDYIVGRLMDTDK